MRNKLIFILALLCGLTAAYLTHDYLEKMKASVDERSYTQILAAAHDIPANTVITGAMVEMKSFPSELMNHQEILDVKQALGKITLTDIRQGEIIFQQRLIKSGERQQGLAYAIPDGMRAMAVAVDEASGLAGLLKIGDRVDVIAQLDGGDDAHPPSSVVVLQDAEVLAIGSSIANAQKEGKDSTAGKTVTLAVTLENSLRLQTAVSAGKISLILRPPADKDFSATAPFNANYFYGTGE